MATHIPIVNYLDLDDPAHLVATTCDECGAKFFGERLACARCGGRGFHHERSARTGTVGSFSIIHRAPAGVEAPYVSAIVDLDDGAVVKANIVGCPADPESVRLGMTVELTTYEVGTDDDGTAAVAFGFVPSKGAS
ncbi:Zn-ribbon domain-containing OB-fold protein [Ilumatobacter nonamiensis]|uniref:Zn-ribbon domain-containing OB-fold protein n=1 Tax=Ilumatobacter nonamiensis TaxID=467093 RepID=UPI00034D9A59|nr:OB-fold domain-containing protein [Ilumatobacter nonamiensis]